MAKLTSRPSADNLIEREDLMHIVDVSDTTGSPSGTSKKIKMDGIPANVLQIATRSDSSQALFTHNGSVETESVVDFGTASNVDVDINAGVFRLLKDIQVSSTSMEMHISKSGGGVGELAFWLEISADGISWAVFPQSLRRIVIANNGNSSPLFDISLGLPISAGTYFRAVAANVGAGSISMSTPGTIAGSKGSITGFAKKASLVYTTRLYL